MVFSKLSSNTGHLWIRIVTHSCTNRCTIRFQHRFFHRSYLRNCNENENSYRGFITAGFNRELQRIRLLDTKINESRFIDSRAIAGGARDKQDPAGRARHVTVPGNWQLVIIKTWRGSEGVQKRAREGNINLHRGFRKAARALNDTKPVRRSLEFPHRRWCK